MAKLSSTIIFLPPATKLGQGYVFTGVCDSVHRGGECLTRYPAGTRCTPPGSGTSPRDQVHPLGPGTPSRTRCTPQTRYTPREQVPPPPGPGTPPGQGRYGLPAGGTHPTGMQSCFSFDAFCCATCPINSQNFYQSGFVMKSKKSKSREVKMFA